MPGTYRLQLTVQGRTYEAPLQVRMDPRVKTPVEELGQQFAAAMRIVELWRRDSTAIGDVRAMRATVDSLKKAAGAGPRADSLAEFDAKLAALLSGGGAGRRPGGAPVPGAAAAGAGPVFGPGMGGGRRGGGRGEAGGERGESGRPPEAGGFAGRQTGGPVQESNLMRLAGELGGLYGIVEGNDSAPTSQAAMQFFSLQRSLQDALGRWDALRQEGARLGVPGR